MTKNKADINRLIIVGNGFDLHYGLKTSFSDFMEFTKAHDNDSFMEIDEFYYLFDDSDEKTWWNDFENQLKDVQTDFIKDYTAGYEELKMLYCVLDRQKAIINEVFGKWVNSIKIITDCTYRFPCEHTFFITFNYTLTLERMFNIPSEKIIHIHNKQGDRQYIFGHDGDTQLRKYLESYYNGEITDKREVVEGIELLQSYVDALKKPVESLSKKLMKELYHRHIFLNKIREVYILGHSLNNIDMPYFRQLREKLQNDVYWHISYHSDLDLQRAKDFVKKFRITNSKIVTTCELLNEAGFC